MSLVRIIPINSTNSAAFEALSKPYIDNKGCVTLDEPKSNDDVKQFLDANAHLELVASKPISWSGGEAFIFSSDKTKPSTLPLYIQKPAIGSTNQLAVRQYANFVAHAHRLIIATTKDNKLHVSMDPRHDAAIFYRTANDRSWSIMRTKVIPKLDYIADLLKHPPIKGLETQLAIHTFEKDGQKTEVLTRFYKGRFSIKIAGIPIPSRPFIQAAPMYIRHQDGRIETGYTPEDFFLDRFKRIHLYVRDLEAQFGTLTSTKKLELTDLALCEPFVRGKTHFVIFKSKRDRNNKSITGSYLQIDGALQQYAIQDDNDTCLSFVIDKLQPTTTIEHDLKTTPTVEVWKKAALTGIKDIQSVPEGVRVNFTDTDYIIDTGTKLTLHGNPQEDYLKAMVLHAKENWGGKFKIDNASDSDKETLIRLAQAHGVRIIGLPISQPTRPLRNPAPPRQAAQAVV